MTTPTRLPPERGPTTSSGMHSTPSTTRMWTPAGIKLFELYRMSDEKLIEHIKKTALDFYRQEAKDLQMFPLKSRVVVLTLNPLDTLGDNQVLEKQQAGFSAINLTTTNFTPEIAEEERLALVVVDEAHMIYIWGLVDSSTSKTSTSAHYRFEDYGIFRPSYGKLGTQLLFQNKKPILLLSATCRPVVVEAIKKSLKLNNDSMIMIKGELTRPEIRMIRLTMTKSLASSLDVINLFPSCRDVPDDKMVPALVYSGSRNCTMTVMEVMDLACETPGGAYRPNSSCIRRFHSCTGDEDKKTCAKDFASGKFPVISCSMALGLGQNWKRVRMVAHVGQGDPANIFQMIGRCGRAGVRLKRCS
ncbi:hypothetical protein MJO29_016669 [Puccinia striiformis f. sp. tritici]|nr:hypothetical protein MJO29_016669 [Puccinia striiformis f. sp. tritici]